jgi:hypothetical protein
MTRLEINIYLWQTISMMFNIKLESRKSCYCAFCKNPRKVYRSKYLSLMAVVGLVGFSFLLSFLVWQEVDARGLAILGLLLLVGEAFHQVRWRQSMICSNCGFDPVLYLKSPEQAGLQIKEFVNYRADRPEYLLRPQIHLPIRKAAKKGQNISLRG